MSNIGCFSNNLIELKFHSTNEFIEELGLKQNLKKLLSSAVG